MEVNVAYKVTEKCLKCGVCLEKCPERAIIVDEEIKDYDGFTFYKVSIDPKKCTDCGVCVSEEYWCPAQAITLVEA